MESITTSTLQTNEINKNENNMLKVYSKTLGSYRPSFYYMKVNFEYHCAHLVIENLKKENLAIFLHEYIHFLQDISTYSLLNNAYVYSEWIYAGANYIYKLPKGNFSIPLRMPQNYANIELNQFVNNACMGEFDSDKKDIGIIRKIQLKTIHIPYENSPIKKIEVPFLILNDGRELKFGTAAIMESMAYLIELEISGVKMGAPEYPYRTAEAVVQKEYPEFGNNIYNVIALCDLSLLFSNPGKIFVETLREYKAENRMPESIEALYNEFYNKDFVIMGKVTKVYNALIEMSLMVKSRLKKYFNEYKISFNDKYEISSSYYSEFHETIEYLLSFALLKRLSHPCFMVDIAKEGFALENKPLKDIINRLGSPIIIDNNKHFFRIPTKDNVLQIKGIKVNDGLEYFIAIQQIYDCFYSGIEGCNLLYDFCEYSNNYGEEIFGKNYKQLIPSMDDNCIVSPWKKCNDSRLCPFAVLWKQWNLSSWTPVTRLKDNQSI